MIACLKYYYFYYFNMKVRLGNTINGVFNRNRINYFNDRNTLTEFTMKLHMYEDYLNPYHRHFQNS